jgi:hypothetical protein
MASMAELKWYLSGGATGAGNTDPTVSIGGLLSSQEILSQTATRVTSLITGVTIINASGNGLGTGTLTYSSTGGTLSWSPYGGAAGTAVDVSVDGTYYIQGANNGGALYVTVVNANLPNATTSDTVTIANQTQKLLDNVSKAESNAGMVDYRMVWLVNEGTVADDDDKLEVKLWINETTPGQDSIAIGLATQAASDGTGTPGVGDCPEVLANDTTAPAGVTFTTPTTEAAALSIGTLSSTAGTTNAKAVWLRRTVPAGVTEAEPNNTFSLAVSAKV